MANGAEITVAEAAKILGVGPRQVRWYREHGFLVGRKIGERLWVFRRDDVEAFVKPKKTGRPKLTAKQKKGMPHAK